MFYLVFGIGYLICVYGVFVFDDEVYCVVEYLKVIGVFEYIEDILIGLFGDDEEGSVGGDSSVDVESDLFYD